MNSLRKYRVANGLSQYELATASGVPRFRIQLAEQGIQGLSVQDLQRIAATLGLKVKDGKLVAQDGPR